MHPEYIKVDSIARPACAAPILRCAIHFRPRQHVSLVGSGMNDHRDDANDRYARLHGGMRGDGLPEASHREQWHRGLRILSQSDYESLQLLHGNAKS